MTPPVMRELPQDRVLTLPAERFYWAVLDSPLVAGRHPSPQQLGYLFESLVPLPIEQVHAVYKRLVGGRILACGMERQELDSQVASAHDGLTMLCPDSLPGFVAIETIDPVSLNLLTAEFEPAHVKHLRRRWRLQAALLMMLLTASIVFGLQRRTNALRDQQVQLDNAKASLLAQVLPVDALASGGGQPPELRLVARLRSLRQTRQGPLGDRQIEDTTAVLAGLLALWPDDVHMQTESLSVTPTSLTLRGSAPSSADVQRLADALAPLPGWQLQQPQINAAGDAVQTQLQFKRRESTPP